MARYSFGIFGQGSGDLQPDLDITMKLTGTQTVKATTGTPSAGQKQIHDNGDGTYYVDDLDTNRYDIYVSSALQDEMTDQLVINEDVSDHITNVPKHREIDDTAGNGDTTKLWSADKIVDYTNANYEPTDATILKQADIDGTSLQFSANKVSIKSSGVETGMIQADAINSDKIADNTIGQEHMKDDTIGSNELIDGSVNLAHLASNSVNADKVVNGSLTSNKMANAGGSGVLKYDGGGSPSVGKIQTIHIDDDTITTNKIDDLMVTRAKIDLKAVDTAQLEDDAVTIDKIEGGSDYGALILADDGTPSYGKITGNHVTSNTLTADHFSAGIMDTTALSYTSTQADFSNRNTSTNILGGFLTASEDSNKFGFHTLAMSSDFKFTEGDAGNQKMSIIEFKPDFSSLNYLSNNKNLNQNLDILDQRLGYLTQFSGTEGLYVMAGSSEWDYRREASGTPQSAVSKYSAQIKDNSSTDQENNTEYYILRKQIYKVPDMRQMGLYVKSYVSSAGGGFKGRFILEIAGDDISTSTSISDEITSTFGSDSLNAVYIDLTPYANYKVYTMSVKMKFEGGTGSSDKTYNLTEFSLVAKRQLTVVDGSTDTYQGDPT